MKISLKTNTLIDQQIIENAASYAQARMRDIHSSHGWDHVQRVLATSKIIVQSEKNADHFIVIVSILLHDIARIDEDQSKGEKCHASLGAVLATQFLLEQGLDEARTQAIAHCIATHRFRDNNHPASIEAKIVYDADKLDSIGAVGIGRAFLFSGEIGAKLHNSDNDILNTSAYSTEDTAYREYIHKLRYVKDKMLTTRGKELAEQRNQFMESFFIRLHDEIKGII